MKDENFYVVFGWMRNQLHLKGCEKEIYAIIYSFSQDGKSEYRGGIDWLVETTEYTDVSVRSAINNLCKKGLMVKTTHKGSTNGLRTVSPDVPRQVKKQKTAKEERKASYDLEAFKKQALNDDLTYERNRK